MKLSTKYTIVKYLVVLILGFSLGFATYAKFFDSGTTIKKVVNKVKGKNNKQDVDQNFDFSKKKK